MFHKLYLVLTFSVLGLVLFFVLCVEVKLIGRGFEVPRHLRDPCGSGSILRLAAIQNKLVHFWRERLPNKRSIKKEAVFAELTH